MVSHWEAGKVQHRAVNACLCPLYAVEGMHVVTVEGGLLVLEVVCHERKHAAAAASACQLKGVEGNYLVTVEGEFSAKAFAAMNGKCSSRSTSSNSSISRSCM
jgi:xanthine dehydrogenase iron-sulfur cluster and FAD-binding subunit A